MKTPKRFLLIDNDPSSNKLCKMALCKIFASPEVFAFTNPESGLEYIEQESTRYDIDTVLFLDINMQPLSGWDVLEKLNSSWSKLSNHFAIYILSSSINPTDKKKATDFHSVSNYLEKPLYADGVRRLFCGIPMKN
ncbi:MAG: response regulator [Flavobacteriaceae bacterium]|nr:response regulator [Flavobacteriaceae bacterium]